jgi:hypothetical protein
MSTTPKIHLPETPLSTPVPEIPAPKTKKIPHQSVYLTRVILRETDKLDNPDLTEPQREKIKGVIHNAVMARKLVEGRGAPKTPPPTEKKTKSPPDAPKKSRTGPKKEKKVKKVSSDEESDDEKESKETYTPGLFANGLFG